MSTNQQTRKVGRLFQISIKTGDEEGFHTIILINKFTYLSRETKLSIQGEKLSLDVVSQILNIFVQIY